MEAAGPKTLLEAVTYFADQDNCIQYLAAQRWPDGVVKCPVCGGTGVGYLAKQKRYQCSGRHPKRQFSIKVGTIMEDSPIGLDKWMPVLWLIANCRNGISSWEIHRDLGVTQKTAWFMLQRVRLAMQDDLTGGMLGGEVEVDESFIGGKARNMHKDRKVRAMKGARGGGDSGNKTIVMGVLERASKDKPKKVRATIIPDRKKATMMPEIKAIVSPDAKVYADEFGSNWNHLGPYDLQMVNHAERYVNGQVHTNGLENFWSLLKRCVGGTYIAVEPFHLFRYIDEQSFRFNNRLHVDGEVVTDAERFSRLCNQIVGKRLTYAQLTGKEQERPEAAF
jgi:ISXO2-like transposase domain/Transposase zinc-ribbon domain